MPLKINPVRNRWLSRMCLLCGFLFYSFIIASYSQNLNDKNDEGRNRPEKPSLELRIPEEVTEPEVGGSNWKISVEVDLVMMYTSVFDKSGHFVKGLKEDNFNLYEDGIEQKIDRCSQEDVPISMGILMDLSGSMRSKIEQVNEAALAFIRASNPLDQVFLIGFNDEVELLQDFTSDVDEITDALDNVVVLGGTALYDAIYLGVQKAHTGNRRKKAVIVITDGEDRDSYYKLNELIAKVQEQDVQVFSIGFLNAIPDKGIFGYFSKSEAEKARDALIRVGEETGGKAFFPDKLTDIHTIVAEIADELRSQYSIGYFSSNSAHDGTFRRVKIKLVGDHVADMRVRYRPGYFASKADEKTSPNRGREHPQ
jgi:Ca-activated chloride channel family protein